MRSKILVLFLLFHLISNGQSKEFKPVGDNQEFRKKLAEAANSIQTIKSDFKQEKNLKLLSEKMVLFGEFWFKKQSMVRMEYTHPLKYLVIINKDKVTLKDEQKTTSYSSKANKLFGVINNIVLDCVKGTVLDNKDFNTLVSENNSQYLLALTPMKKEVKDYFSQVNIYLDKKDFSVMSINMVEPSGDNTLITFSNKQYNMNIPDAIFSVK